MSDTTWRYAVASVVGTAHASGGRPGQDVGTCRALEVGDALDVLVGVVADGAGSAPRAEAGAELACSFFNAEVAAHYAAGADLAGLTRDVAVEWLVGFAREMDGIAAAEGREARDFACTLLAAIVEPERAVFLQIGDGAIVVGRREEPDAYACVFWPQRGEYANQTSFATDPDASRQLAFERWDEPIDEVSLFTDGLQHLVLHEATKTAHAPFFRAVFAPIRGEAAGLSERLSIALAGLLDSARVNQRTDDDKTLILATRPPSRAGELVEARRDGAG